MQIENNVHYQYLAEELGKSGFHLDKSTFDPERLVFHKAKKYIEYSVVLNKRTMSVEVYHRDQLVSLPANGGSYVSVLPSESGVS